MADSDASLTSRWDDEILAITAMYPESCVGGSASRSLTVSLGEASITFTATARYPEETPGIAVTSSAMPHAQKEAISVSLGKVARESEGECLYELLQAFQSLLCESSEALGASPRPPKEDTGEIALVFIDHMNKHKPYLTLLHSWALQYNLTGQVYFKKRSRIEGVHVVLTGPGGGVTRWLTRLRTEYVDVDKRGRKCKERKGTLVERRVVEGVVVQGWEEIEYADEEDVVLRAALRGFGFV